MNFNITYIFIETPLYMILKSKSQLNQYGRQGVIEEGAIVLEISSKIC